MRKLAVLFHRYLGLALAILLSVSSLTGAMIVFAKPIDAWLNPHLLQVEPQVSTVPVDDLIAAVGEAAPANRIGTVFIPQTPGLAWEFWFQDDATLRAYVNPHTGAVLGTRRATDSLMGFLVDLHIHLLAGHTGQTIVGWAGVGAIFLSGLGLYLWWPKRGRWSSALSIKWSAAPARLWLEIHKVAGALAAVLIMLTAGTGALITLHDVITEPLLVALTGDGVVQAPQKSLGGPGPDAPLAPMLAAAQATYPNGRLSRISFPSRVDAPVVVRMRLEGDVHQFGRSFLWFDRYDGRLLKTSNILEANLASRIQNWFYPLHTGFYGGTATRWLQVAAGLTLALITLSGVWLWWRNWRGRRAAARRNGAVVP
jgi:uncharacterized iron-regulated membrane protein